MKDFKSFRRYGWKLRILAWRILARKFRFKIKDNLSKEDAEGLFANLSLCLCGDLDLSGD